MLTPAQEKALVELRDDTRFGFRNASLANRTANALDRKGLVEWRPGHTFGGRWHLTEAGHDAIAASQRDEQTGDGA